MSDTVISTADYQLIRLYLGDTDPSNELVSDESIDLLWGVALDPVNHKLIAADLAMHLAGKYSKSVSFSVEGLSISSSQKAEAYRQLAEDLRDSASADDITNTGASTTPGDPFVGGVSLGEMQSVDDDTDRTPSSFKVGMHDAPGS